ncbi:MAG: tetratricopeptide repeat protein [Deltaproteobacteria bacterium]|nr:tetratricopeptide repeat protein [Deltaproteobacteria bacterium]
MPHDYSAREVAELLGLSLAEVRRCAKAGFLTAQPDASGDTRFSFQDLVLLRNAARLVSGRVRPHRVRRALSRLREQLPADRPLSGVQVLADGRAIVAQEGARIWNPLSGQMHLNFDSTPAPPTPLSTAPSVDVERLYDQACRLEDSSPADAEAAYRVLIRLAPAHVDARINLGRLLHDSGRIEEAVEHYRAALSAPNPVASFNLGVALEDLGRVDDAVASYHAAIDADPRCEDAFYNLARIHERRGERVAALRALRTYRELTRG